MRKPSRHMVWKLAIVATFATLYSGVFLSLGSRVAFAGAPFAAAAVITGAWFFGSRGGLLTMLFVVCEGTVLLRLTVSGSWITMVRQAPLAGLVAVILMGVAIGRMSDLERRVNTYARQLQFQAFHDPLTGLPNRALFSDRLEHATERVARSTGSLAVLFIDLDDFKQINDRHGHAAGDLVLQAVAQRLKTSLRSGDTVARLGGDEFVALLEDIPDLDSARQTAARLADTIVRPYLIDDGVYTVSASIGVAFCPAGFTGTSDLLLEADRAMYRAKATGSGHYQIAQPLVA